MDFLIIQIFFDCDSVMHVYYSMYISNFKVLIIPVL